MYSLIAFLLFALVSYGVLFTLLFYMVFKKKKNDNNKEKNKQKLL